MMTKYLLVVLFSVIVNAQTIVNSPQLSMTGGSAAYSTGIKEIWLNADDKNSLAVERVLHELGHHIWFHGGVDTVAYKNRYNDGDVWEAFANDHVYYLLGWLNKNELNYQIFYEFYNRSNNND
jgi:hypothetical protein